MEVSATIFELYLTGGYLQLTKVIITIFVGKAQIVIACNVFFQLIVSESV